MNTPLKTAILAVFAVLPLTGCLDVLSTPKPIDQVILNPHRPDASLCSEKLSGVRLLVPLPESSAGLASDRIALIFDQREVRYLADAKWDSPVPEMFQRLLVQYLGSTGCFDGVGSASSGITARYRLLVDLQRLHLVYQSEAGIPTAQARLGLSVLDIRSGAVLDSQVLEYSQPASGKDKNQLLDAMDTVTAKILIEASAWTARTIENAPALEADQARSDSAGKQKRKNSIR